MIKEQKKEWNNKNQEEELSKILKNIINNINKRINCITTVSQKLTIGYRYWWWYIEKKLDLSNDDRDF